VSRQQVNDDFRYASAQRPLVKAPSERVKVQLRAEP
jgi:hypothetical protein